MNTVDRWVGMFLVGVIIGLSYLIIIGELNTTQEPQIVKELTVTEVTKKERQLTPNVSEIYYVWKVCDGDFCFDMERNRTVKLGYKLR